MSANLYSAKDPGRYYHIHGSLEASTTLKMIGLAPYRPDLKTHEAIVGVIEPAVQKFSVQELERLNLANRQAGTEALKYTDFIKTPHVSDRQFSYFAVRHDFSRLYQRCQTTNNVSLPLEFD